MRVFDRRYFAGDISLAYSETGAGDTQRAPEIYAVGAAQTAHEAHGSNGPRSGQDDHIFLLVHGIGMGRGVFTGLAELLGAHGTVISVDLPGFGDSPRSKSAVTIEQNAEAIARFIAVVIPGRLTLIGHSMGTQVVAEVALRHPERVNALVLIAPTVDRHARRALTQIARMLHDLTDDSAKVFVLGLWQYLKSNVFAFVRRFKMMMRHRLEDICPHINTPTLVIRGAEDRVCPRLWTSEIADALPHGTMREIVDHGHEAVIDDAKPASRLILDFVNGKLS